jgi:hypothetical protein
MKPVLSILMPAIRQYNWDKIYDSITESTNRPFELIIVGPTCLTEKLANKSNVKYLKDFGHPNRCWNLAMLLAEGQYTTWMSDDGFYQTGVLDKVIGILDAEPDNEKLIVSMATIEAGHHYSESFCYINAQPEMSSPYIPNNFRFLALGTFHTNYLLKLGGLNCILFETYAMAHKDISIRAQYDGAKIVFLSDIAIIQGHMPGTSGDHAPIHYAQTAHDEIEFKRLYHNSHTYIDLHRPLDDWKKVSPIWARRFGIK